MVGSQTLSLLAMLMMRAALSRKIQAQDMNLQKITMAAPTLRGDEIFIVCNVHRRIARYKWKSPFHR